MKGKTMNNSATVSDYMTRELITFNPETDILNAITELVDRHLSGAPVVDDNNNLVGVLSKKDCLKVAYATSYHQDLGGKVADYMNSPVETVEADMEVVEMAEHFLNSQYRRFPVMEHGRLVGQVSRQDILRAIKELW